MCARENFQAWEPRSFDSCAIRLLSTQERTTGQRPIACATLLYPHDYSVRWSSVGEARFRHSRRPPDTDKFGNNTENTAVADEHSIELGASLQNGLDVSRLQ